MLVVEFLLRYYCMHTHQGDKNEPGLQNSPTEFTASGSFENSMSNYTKESVITDDLVYPIYTAQFDYEASSPSELSFRKGDQMHIKSKGDGKTWYASLTAGKGKQEGYIPKSHVTALDDEE